jgi:hypothetical protein
MILSVRRFNSLPLYGISFACEDLTFDYNWGGKIIFRVWVFEIGVMEMSFADIFRHLTLTFHTDTSGSNSTVINLSRLWKFTQYLHWKVIFLKVI